jgi:hypothetical protein
VVNRRPSRDRDPHQSRGERVHALRLLMNFGGGCGLANAPAAHVLYLFQTAPPQVRQAKNSFHDPIQTWLWLV